MLSLLLSCPVLSFFSLTKIFYIHPYYSKQTPVMSQTMSQDNILTPQAPTGLMDLATEIRLMIFGEVFREADGNAISHPLLYVCRTTRLEYIAAFSGKLSLALTGWCTPFTDQKPKPTFIISRSSDGKCILPRRWDPGYGHMPSIMPHMASVHTSRWLEEDFEAFANSPFSWWMSHVQRVVFDPFILQYLNPFEAFITFEVKRKDRLIPMAVTSSHILYPGEDLRPLDRKITILAEARIAQWKALTENPDDEERLTTFTHCWISDFVRTVVDDDFIGDVITAVYGSRHGYDRLTRLKWHSPGAFLMTWLHR